MKEKIKKHYKFILGIVVGLILSSLVAYAATAVASSNVSYSNTTSGLSSTTVQGAIDELYEKTKKNIINVDLSSTSNFGRDTLKVVNVGNDLRIDADNANTEGVAYFSQKITVTSSAVVKAYVSIFHNVADNHLLGTAYMGFSKTNEIRTDDYVSYIKRDVSTNVSNRNSETISIYINDPGEYFFKVYLSHNDTSLYNTCYVYFSSLSFEVI